MPLIAYLAFVMFTFLSLYMSPAKYVDMDIYGVTLYVSIVATVFSLGYFLGSSGRLYSPWECEQNFSMLIAQRKTQFIINTLIIISLCGVAFELLMFFKC